MTGFGGPTAQLARFAAQLRLDDVPAEVVEHAKTAVLDVFGCALYGSTRPWAALVRDEVLADRARPAAAVWGSAERTSPSLAALANGTSAHSAELDDLNRAAFFHPSAASVPAACAVADDDGAYRFLTTEPDRRPDGATLLTAIIAGYEVGSRVGIALGQGHFLAGYHPQGTAGVFTAAAAAGRMAGLSPEQMQHALGTAGSQAAGLMSAQEGSMVKRLHAGFACQAGVRAVALAARGFTGIDTVLEAEFGGLLGTLGTPASDATALTAGLGSVWQTAALEFKRHAACAAIHTSLDVAADLSEMHSIRAAEVAAVTVDCTTHSFLHCGFDYRPTGAGAAQMSFQYCLAAMLRFGVVSIDQFTDDLLAEPDLLALAARIEVRVDPSFDALGADNRHTVRVNLRMRDGAEYVGERRQRRGSTTDPLPAREIEAKFRLLAGHLLPGDQVEQLRVAVSGLTDLSDARELAALLQPDRTRTVQE